MTEQEQIDKFIAERGVTKCPDAYAVVVQQPPDLWPGENHATKKRQSMRRIKHDWAFRGLPQLKA